MDDFISLAALVRRANSVPSDALATNQLSVAAAEVAFPAPRVDETDVDFAHADKVRGLNSMRLAALEAFERAKDILLEGLAAEVLGRELALGAVDLDALARATLARFADLEPVTLIVSQADAGRICSPLPLRIDPALGAGDLTIEVRDGTLESTFDFRLQSVLERATAGTA